MRWSDRALGREVIEERIEYHLQRRDIQTAATILCIVDPPKPKTATKRPERTNSRTRSSFPPPVTRRVRSSNSESDTSATLRQHFLDAAGRDGAVEATETSASVVDSAAAAAVAIPSNARGSSLRKPRNISLNMSFSEMSFGGLSKLQRCHSESTAPPGSSNVNNAAATSGVSVNSGNVSSSYGAAHSASTFASATPLVSFPPVEHAEAAPVATEDFLADPAKSQRNEAVKRWYSQFLRRLGMDIKSVEVAKFLKSNPDEQEFRIGLRDPCEACAARDGADADPVTPVNPVSWSDIARGSLGTDADCADCSAAATRARRWRRCAVCRLPVRGGLFSICLYCGHGGHVAHLRDWFESEGGSAACPSGCGCRCEELRMDPNYLEEQASA